MVELVRRDQQRVSMWSGGTTTEIAIYPKDAAYSRRDFLWRISSAHVEAENSAFTSLPGIWRLIMVLEGDLTLEHEDHHSARLQPFQQDAFAGDWITRSTGRARDFNIMLSSASTAQMWAVSLQGRSDTVIPVEAAPACDECRQVVVAVYGVDGAVTVEVDTDDTWSIETADALLWNVDQENPARSVRLFNKGSAPIHVVLATIRYEGAQ